MFDYPVVKNTFLIPIQNLPCVSIAFCSITEGVKKQGWLKIVRPERLKDFSSLQEN